MRHTARRMSPVLCSSLRWRRGQEDGRRLMQSRPPPWPNYMSNPSLVRGCQEIQGDRAAMEDALLDQQGTRLILVWKGHNMLRPLNGTSGFETVKMTSKECLDLVSDPHFQRSLKMYLGRDPVFRYFAIDLSHLPEPPGCALAPPLNHQLRIRPDSHECSAQVSRVGMGGAAYPGWLDRPRRGCGAVCPRPGAGGLAWH